MHTPKTFLPLAALALLGLAAAQPVQAQTLNGSTADNSIGSFAGNPAATNLTTGGFYSDYQFDAEFVFQLPTLLPGQTFTSSSFNTFVENANATSGDPLFFDIAVEGLDARATPTVLNSDYHFDGGAGPAGTLIQSQFVKTTYNYSDGVVPTGAYTTSSTGSTNLTNYLNAQAAALPGGYVFLRLTPQSDPSGTASGVNFSSADNANVTQRPTITYTLSVPVAAPEPSQFAAFAVGVLGLGTLVARRRKVAA